MKELYAALAKAHSEISGVKKAKKNPHFKSTYAGLDDVYDAIREPLKTNGLLVIQLPITTDGGMALRTMVVHPESGQELDCGLLAMPLEKPGAHAIGSAITYARRYVLMSIMGVAPEDDDGNEAQTSAPRAKKKAPPMPHKEHSCPDHALAEAKYRELAAVFKAKGEEPPRLGALIADSLGKIAKTPDEVAPKEWASVAKHISAKLTDLSVASRVAEAFDGVVK